MSPRCLDDQRAAVVEALCETFVPGSEQIGPSVYVDALLARMPDAVREMTLGAIDSLADVADGGPEALATRFGTPEFFMVRALAIEAYYSDFVAPGAPGPSAWEEIDFRFPLADRVKHDWSYLGVGGMSSSERYDVAVVGSGAGGGLIAGQLAQRGRMVVLLEAGPHRTAADFTRWEAHATHDIWWPFRQAFIDGGAAGTIPMIAGRCVGGTTTINTKVAPRATANDLAKWVGHGGLELTVDDLAPHYDRVEQQLGVRVRDDWPDAVHMLNEGFKAIGSELHPVRSYTDHNCMKCGSCLQGCPTNAGKNSMNVYIHPPWAEGRLDLRADAPVERVIIEDRNGGPEAVGVEYVDSRTGERHVIEADAVVVAGGACNTPQVLIRSGMTNPWIGRNLGFHPVRLVYGLFDEPQDGHRMYPITSHCMDHQHDEDGGFVIEAATTQDPIGFAISLEDENGPMWGKPLVEAAKQYRNWIGLLSMANDENNGAVVVQEDGSEWFDAHFEPSERQRIDDGLAFSVKALEAAGAKRVLWSGIASTHVQGSCRMGSDPAQSVVDAHGESHDVRRLFVGDGSVVPRTLSVNPSLTIMALADRLMQHIDADEKGYLSSPRAAVAA